MFVHLYIIHAIYTYNQNPTVTASILCLRPAKESGVAGREVGVKEDQFYHWHVLESLVHVGNQRQTDTAPVCSGFCSQYVWWPGLDSHEGGKQGSIVEYTQRTVVVKEELGSEIGSMLSMVSN